MVDTHRAVSKPGIAPGNRARLQTHHSHRTGTETLVRGEHLRTTRNSPNPAPPYASTTLLRRRLGTSIAISVLVVGLLVCFAYVALNTLTAIHAYNRGAQIWIRSLDAAVDDLKRYATSANELELRKFRRDISVPLGDKHARLELQQVTPDYARVAAAMRRGGNSAQDIPEMISLFRGWQKAKIVSSAVAVWAAADHELDEIVGQARRLHAAIDAVPASPPANMGHAQVAAAQQPAGTQHIIADSLVRIDRSLVRISALHQQFSAILSRASLTTKNTIELAMVAFGLLLIAVNVAVAFWVLRAHEKVVRALYISEERLDLAVEASADGVWDWHGPDSPVYFSPRALHLLAHAGDAAPSLDALVDSIHPDDQISASQAFASIRDGCKLVDIEFRMRANEAGFRWLRMRGRELRASQHAHRRMAGLISDISDRKHEEQRQRATQAKERRQNDDTHIRMLESIQGKIGRELHDDLGQRLTGIAFLMKAMQQRLVESQSPEIDQARWIVRLTNDAIDRIRFLSRQLNLMEIDSLSIDTAMEAMVGDVRKIYGTQVSLCVTGSGKCLPPADAGQLFRIAQEAIANALKHGAASRIDVRLQLSRSRTRLAIRDNGCGFVPRAVDRNVSLGMRSMLMRAARLSGDLRIRSNANGTMVLVRARPNAKSKELGRQAWTNAG